MASQSAGPPVTAGGGARRSETPGETRSETPGCEMCSDDRRFRAAQSSPAHGVWRVRVLWAADSADGHPMMCDSTSLGRAMMWDEALTLWESDTVFADFYAVLVAKCPFPNFFWECPPLTAATAPRIPFEFVCVIASPFKAADPSEFASQIDYAARSGSAAAAFASRDGDAVLVAPVGGANRHVSSCGALVYDASCGSIGDFIRGAPREAAAVLWRCVGSALHEVLQRRGENPTWVSTAGKDVPWVHVRLDTSPKYYTWALYKPWPSAGQ